jgi:hypothetical protein
VTLGAAGGQPRMAGAGQRIVVAIEDREHPSAQTVAGGNSTAGSPSMLRAFFSRW